jgi:hypothetical protein
LLVRFRRAGKSVRRVVRCGEMWRRADAKDARLMEPVP